MSSDIHALSGAYAVDALDDAERAEFEQHLATCETCRDEVADLQLAAVELAATVEATPPPSLRESVLAGIAEVRPLPPLADNVRTLPTRRNRILVALAAAAAIVVGGTTVAVQPWDQDPPAQYSQVDQVLQAADVERYSATVEQGGTVTVYRSVALDRAVVVTRGLAPAPTGKVYELWLQAPSGEMAPAGLFDNGTDLRQLVLGSAGTARGLGITVEPAGGSPVPTTQPIALVPLA